MGKSGEERERETERTNFNEKEKKNLVPFPPINLLLVAGIVYTMCYSLCFSNAGPCLSELLRISIKEGFYLLSVVAT